MMPRTTDRPGNASREKRAAAPLFVALCAAVGVVFATAQMMAAETAAERGYRLLRTKAYLPQDFDQQTFDELWKTWEEPLRSQAERATAEERRKMAFRR